MKIKINTSEESTTSTGKTYKRANVMDEFGKMHDVSVWPDFTAYAEVEEGNMVEGIILTKGKFKNLVGSTSRPQSSFSRTGQIKEAQERKETSIEHAQKRTAEMWAKNGAWTIVAHHPAYKDLKPQDIEGVIETLARNILDMDIRPDPFKN